MGSIPAIIAELLKLANLIMGHSNSPEMVANKLADIHQQLKDQNEPLEATLADPTKSQAEKDAALQAIGMTDS